VGFVVERGADGPVAILRIVRVLRVNGPAGGRSKLAAPAGELALQRHIHRFCAREELRDACRVAYQRRASCRRNGEYARAGFRKKSCGGIRKIVGCPVPADLTAKLAILAEYAQEVLIVLPALRRLEVQKIFRLEQVFQIHAGLTNEESGPDVPIFVELRRASVSRQRAYTDFQNSAFRDFLRDRKSVV